MMNWRIGAAVVLAAGAACAFPAYAQVDEAALTTLKDSAAAIEKIGGVTYKSKLYGVGALKEIMDGEGEVRQLRIAGKSGKSTPFWAKGEVKELGKGKTPFTISTDGLTVDWIDDPANTHFRRPLSDRASDGSKVMSLGQQLVMTEFSEAAPFAKQLKAEKMELKANEQVHGVDCKVIFVTWEGGLRSEIWWIGAQDKLPRKIEMAHGQNRDLAKGTEIWDVKPLDSAALTHLEVKAPAGYKTDFQAAPPAPIQVNKPDQQMPNTPPPPPPVVGLAPGSQAPEFDLKASDGKSVKVSSLKGDVVVLTFGGSKFPKTDGVNANVEQVIGGFAGKNVKAFTLACREDSEQAATAHVSKAGHKVPLLLGADNVRNDYKVAGFPFTYVLTADGRVSRAFQGNVTKEQLQKAIDAALKGEIAPIAAAPAPAAPATPVAPQPVPIGKPDLSPTKK